MLEMLLLQPSLDSQGSRVPVRSYLSHMACRCLQPLCADHSTSIQSPLTFFTRTKPESAQPVLLATLLTPRM